MRTWNDEGTQMQRWMMLGMLGPLAGCAGNGYMAVTLAATAMLPLTLLTGDGFEHLKKGAYLLLWIWTPIVLGSLLPDAGAYWPGEKTEIVVPGAIMVLVVLSGSWKKATRTGNSLFWLALIPGGIILMALAGKVEVNDLTPETGQWSGTMIATLLIPALGKWSGTASRKKTETVLLTAVAAAGLAILVQGGLGFVPGSKWTAPLYELGRCVGNGGVEILISVVMTFAWYALAAMMIARTGDFGTKAGIGPKTSFLVPVVIAAGMILWRLEVSGTVLTAGCLIVWILIPMMSQKNNLKKDEKRC